LFVKKRQLALTIGSIITGIVIVFSSCKKINEATELGGDLIPPIDNIHTFDTTLTVEAYNGLFGFNNPDPLLNDSTISVRSDEHFLGVIDNDPIFGKTDAQLFMEFKPPFFPRRYINTYDSLILDSVVLILNYVETYGDKNTSQTISVYEIAPVANNNFRPDSTDFVRVDPNYTLGSVLGSKIVLPASLSDTVRARNDTINNQLRIPLTNAAFNDKLLRADTSGANNAFLSDSTFKLFFRGFALKSSGGKAIMGFDLLGASTKLAIYYRDDNNGSAVQDTTVDYFTFAGNASAQSSNYIQRDYSSAGTFLAAQGGTLPDPLVYIQATPGSFATIKIPALTGLNNRVVHRAELIAEEVFDPSDTVYTPPTFLFLDAHDPAISKYRTVPYDLVFDGSSNSFNFGSFGIAPVNALDGGNIIKTWHFNLTRYVQHIVSGATEPLYDLRLFAPFYIIDQYKAPVAGATSFPIQIPINSAVAKGRVRLAGNTGPTDPNPHKMRLRIIYSKL
jgi:hypothetical protein